ncbi:hypothetical protein Dsin_005122 [Dipteronia sinensis]|uniref:Uncharacterized protein n=1 Tax=Dipteronia sinensis TaxID=43782 RepID=A0AAE0AWT6_9ROSI|nr:hypothetical protein Dsin_005122 [Dipteronia sinensis]
MGLNTSSYLPQVFKHQIDKLKGTDVMLVDQKEMTSKDMDNHQGRFSMPRGKVITRDFISEDEIDLFDQNLNDGIKWSLIQLCLEEITDFELNKWTMNKTFSYTLIRRWKSVAYNERNRLQIGCVC